MSWRPVSMLRLLPLKMFLGFEWKHLKSRQQPPVTWLVAVDGGNETCVNSSGGVQQGWLGPCYQLCTVNQPTSLPHLSTHPHASCCCQDTKDTCSLSCPAGPEGPEMVSREGKKLKCKQSEGIREQGLWSIVTSWVWWKDNKSVCKNHVSHQRHWSRNIALHLLSLIALAFSDFHS